MMEILQKRKRPAVYTIASDDSDDCEVVSLHSDGDYEPAPKKAKKSSNAPKKVIKPKKEPKPKTAPKKTEKKAKVPRKPRINKTSVLNNKEIYSIPSDEEHVIIIPDENGANSVEIPPSSTKIEELEKSALRAVVAAKQSYQPWRDEEVVSESAHVPVEIARGVIELLNQECTIPFIVRYRKQVTGGLQAEKIRDIQSSYEEVKTVHKKVESILKTIRHEKFDESVARSFLSAKSLDEVELLYAPFKPGSKRTLAERSKQLGLEPISVSLLEGTTPLDCIDLSTFIKQQKGLETEEEIRSGIQHIIADKVSKDRRVLDFIRSKVQQPQIRIQSCKSATAEKEDKKANVEGKTTQNFKYENYYQLNVSISTIAPHQVMALNRGEKQKVLKVKIQIPPFMKKDINNFIWWTFFDKKRLEQKTFEFMKSCLEYAYDRLIEPYMCRQIRSELTKKSEKESINVFGSNVRSLVLTPPVRGKTVIGIDPGFSHGCKVATVSSRGEVLETGVIFPHSKGKFKNNINDGSILKSMVCSHKAEIIAIGNGTACRETELWLSTLIKSHFFQPFDVKYCIVNENGASIYSVTKEAEIELPGMDPNLRSAVSIARRLQDPLLEYVKIEPKHLGVGMYQHDISETDLKKALDSIVEECVSFVGVDLNVCTEILLRRISGLSTAKAKQIVEWRSKNNGFVNRKQLLEVKGLGPKSFEQCAGFVRILPGTASRNNAVPKSSQKKKEVHRINPLDRTIIHPESYDISEKFLKELKLNPENIGQQAFVDEVEKYMKFQSAESVASKMNTPVSLMQLIIDALKQLQDYDIRAELDQPLFRTGVQSFSDLRRGQELTGRVTNVTGFGSFVDAGVGTNGLIHVSKSKGRTLSVGDRVRVKVLDVDQAKKRLGLELVL